MITQLKSVVLSMGMIDRHLTVEQAVLLSRLEEEYQVEYSNMFCCYGFSLTVEFLLLCLQTIFHSSNMFFPPCTDWVLGERGVGP